MNLPANSPSPIRKPHRPPGSVSDKSCGCAASSCECTHSSPSGKPAIWWNAVKHIPATYICQEAIVQNGKAPFQLRESPYKARYRINAQHRCWPPAVAHCAEPRDRVRLDFAADWSGCRTPLGLTGKPSESTNSLSPTLCSGRLTTSCACLQFL